MSNQGKVPNIPIFVDSPLGGGRYGSVSRASEQSGLHHEDPFGFQRLKFIREAGESKKLNNLHGPFIVISASGVCEQGRIRHHLRNSIADPRNTVLITGFMAVDTLGRKPVEKWKEANIFGEPMRVRAEISSLDDLSGHPDRRELMNWLQPLASHLKRVFRVHGEPAQQQAPAALIHQEYGIEALAPQPGASFDLT